MKHVDLLPFAEFSEKIPSSGLGPQKLKEPSSWQVLGAHFVDFIMSFFVSAFMCFMFNHTIKILLVTKGLKLAYSEALILGMSGPILPLTMLSYLFFSYFFNHGQTYGMYTFKIRASMKSQSFREAFTWAVHSLLLCFSCGLSYFFKPSIWNGINTHDHLYQELVSYKEDSSLNLQDLLKDSESEEAQELRAA